MGNQLEMSKQSSLTEAANASYTFGGGGAPNASYTFGGGFDPFGNILQHPGTSEVVSPRTVEPAEAPQIATHPALLADTAEISKTEPLLTEGDCCAVPECATKGASLLRLPPVGGKAIVAASDGVKTFAAGVRTFPRRVIPQRRTKLQVSSLNV